MPNQRLWCEASGRFIETCAITLNATDAIYVEILVIVVKICYKFKYKSNM